MAAGRQVGRLARSSRASVLVAFALRFDEQADKVLLPSQPVPDEGGSPPIAVSQRGDRPAVDGSYFASSAAVSS